MVYPMQASYPSRLITQFFLILGSQDIAWWLISGELKTILERPVLIFFAMTKSQYAHWYCIKKPAENHIVKNLILSSHHSHFSSLLSTAAYFSIISCLSHASIKRCVNTITMQTWYIKENLPWKKGSWVWIKHSRKTW